MIFYLLFFYLLSESMASNCSNDSTSYDVTDKIICRFQGDNSILNPRSDDVDPKTIPCECDLIEFLAFSINQSSIIDVNEELLKAVTALNISILLPLVRSECYSGWTSILGPDGNYNDAKILCDFATKYNIKGYIIYGMEPCNNETVNKNIPKYIIPYITQLKELCPCNFIIGMSIPPFRKIYKNRHIYNFEELNYSVMFYVINTLVVNTCNPTLFNGGTPNTTNTTNTTNTPVIDDYYILKKILRHLKETKINFSILVFDITVSVYKITENTLSSYTEMCKTGFDNLTSCAPTSEDYYKKGKYFRELHFGIKITELDLDDFLNTCECKSAFNGFYNIRAGYTGGSVTPCAKFDVQSTNHTTK